MKRLKPHLQPVLLLVVATFAVYAQSLGHEFLADWDDHRYVTANEAVRGFTLEHLKTAFTSFHVGNYAPLQIISYMLDYTVWGMLAAGFIFTNILLHALNGLLYYALLFRLNGKRTWAFAASFIFLLHPVQVESVVWISQRKNVLAMFFLLVSFLLYTAYRKAGAGSGEREKANQPSNLKPRTSNLLYAGSVTAFILALLTKSVAVILPPVLLLYDLCYTQKERRGSWLVDKVPYLAAAGIVALVALKTQVPEFEGGRTGYHGGSPLATLYTMLPIVMRYLGMLFWPANLSAVYNPPIRTGMDWAVALSGLALVGLCAGGYYLYRLRKDLFFWGSVFFIGLLPVLQIVPLVTLMNDRYLYFPMLGSAAFIAGLSDIALARLTSSSRRMMSAGLCFALLILPVLSFKRAEVWRNSQTLWQDAYSKVPDSALVLGSMGSVYRRKGDFEMALPFYLRTLVLDPMDRDSLNNISVVYMGMGQFDKAQPYLNKLIANYPDFAPGLRTFGYYCLMTGDFVRGEAALRKSLTLQPQSGVALRNLGTINLLLKRPQIARDYYHQALALGEKSADLYYTLACLDATDRNVAAALEHLEAAFRLGFRDAEAIAGSRELDSLRGLPEFQRLVAAYLQTAGTGEMEKRR